MSTSPENPTPATPAGAPAQQVVLVQSNPAGGTAQPKEIKIIGHSPLFYWWPVWFFGFIFAIWTAIENNRMVIVNDTAIIKKTLEEKNGKPIAKVIIEDEQPAFLMDGKITELEGGNFKPRPRVTASSWMGPLYLTILLATIMVTNVPLRGLWSLLTIIGAVTTSLLISLLGLWDKIFDMIGGLHIFTNMAGYLFLSTVLFIFWAIAYFIFDRRTYIIFSQGAIKVCEEIGGREKVYDSTGATIEKQRSDWFRHMIFGFGSGDLLLTTAGAEKTEIKLQNVAMIGSKLGPIETFLRTRQVGPKI